MLQGVSKHEALLRGQMRRQRMIEMVAQVAQFNQTDKFQSLYLFSEAGMGKTFTVNQYLTNAQVPHFCITGNTSLFALGVKLATINYQNPEMLPLIISIDDCDEILKDSTCCNTIKQLLEGKKAFNYEKSLYSQMSGFNQLQLKAIQHYSEEGRMGFCVPAHNMRFIFTSNFELPDESVVAKARQRGSNKAVLYSHRHAIRSRVINGSFKLDPIEHYGWIADVIYNTDCLNDFNLSDSQKEIILDFLWNNWSNMVEKSIRTVEKMVQIMVSMTNDYERIWKLDFTKTY